MLSVLTFWSTIEILPFHVRSAMPQSVNCCMSSAIVLLLILGIWMIFNYNWYDFLPINYDIVGKCSPTNVATFECSNICENRRLWEKKSQQLALMPAVRSNASRLTLVGSPPGWDPTKVDTNITTFAWNASQMSDHSNVPPSYCTDFALALCWL